LFFDLHWKRDGKGKIVFTPATSLETWHTATNPLPEIAGLNFVLPQLLKLKPGLVSQEQRQRWQKLLDSLPPLPLKQENGKRYLLPAQSFESKMNIENPELYAIFPYRLYGIGKPDLDIALETFTRRLTKASGGWFQDAIDAACLGLAQEAWRNIVNNFRPVAGTSDRSQDPNCRFAGFWGPNADWTPDQDQPSVAMIALQRMLLQPDGDKILLFPAWPHDLDVEFKLRTSHNTVIEASLKNGKAAVVQTEPASRQRDVHSYVQ
jgi:alpha-L-fucosidase 2